MREDWTHSPFRSPGNAYDVVATNLGLARQAAALALEALCQTHSVGPLNGGIALIVDMLDTVLRNALTLTEENE